MTNDNLLHTYLHHHWVAASAGLATFERVARSHSDPEVAAEVGVLAEEIGSDRQALRQILEAVGTTPPLGSTALGRGLELVGRLKPNGHLIRRAPLSDLLELEALQAAVAGKRAGFLLLRRLAEEDERLDRGELDTLIARAEDQQERLARLHAASSVRTLRGR